MRSIAYFFCAALVALPTFRWLIGSLLSPLKVQIPYDTFLSLLSSFGSLLPPMLIGLLPRPIILVIGYATMFLVLRRTWLFIVKKERTPASFVGFQKALGYIGFWSFSLAVLVFLLSMALKAGSG